jgi:hypothetical protein
MPLSKLLPSRALLWKDWRHTLPIFLVFASFITFVSTLTLAYQIVSYRAAGAAEVTWLGENWPGFRDFYRLLESSMGLAGAVMVFNVVLLGVVSLGQEREKGTIALLLGMPYSRRDILNSKVVVSLLQISLPFIANALLMTLLLWTNRGVNFPFGVGAVWSWAMHSVLVLTFVLCVTLLASAVSGKMLGAAFLALVLLLFPFGMSIIFMANVAQWTEIGLVSPVQGLLGYWSDLLFMDAAKYLTIPIWLVDFPAVLSVNTIAYVNMRVVDLVFANRVWNFLLAHTYVLYLLLVGLSFGVYILTQKWFGGTELEREDELLALPRLRPLISVGFTGCSALLGGAVLPALLGQPTGTPGVVVMLLSYASSAAIAWVLASRFLGGNTTGHLSQGETKGQRSPIALLVIGLALVTVALIATFGIQAIVSRQLTDAESAHMLALADAVMERRTRALVGTDGTPTVVLSNDLARESPELHRREQALSAELAERREALRQRGEAYIRSETHLVLISARVRQDTATVVALEQSKLYYARAHPAQPEYMAWEAERGFVFMRRGGVWELTEHGVMDPSKGLPPNEPRGN